MFDGLLPLGAGLGQQFDDTVLVLGGLLVGGALLSGLARRSVLSLTAVFVLAGFVLGEGGLEVLAFDPRSEFVGALATVALIVILFRDGLEVEAEMLQTAWHLPLRKLVLAMPITGALIACVTKLVTDLSWTEAFLIGALLSPTDPVLSSSVVTNPRVPRVVRHSLNVESGMNDGLALPAVLAFIAALSLEETDFVWWEFVLQDVSVGLATGIVVGVVAGWLLPKTGSLEGGMPAHQKALYALGVAFGTYGVAVAAPEGNGFIAVFVSAMTLGILRPDVRASFEVRSDDIIEVIKLGVFVVFGALLTLDGVFGDGLATVAIVAFTLLVARPVAVFAALIGTGTDTATKTFMSWFGPKGVATMTFSLLVLAEPIPGNERIFNIAALAVLVSIIAHGLTDKAGVDWIERRGRHPAPEQAPAPGAGQGGALA
jgi:NhaP-type Na+/H+ or K+/H+ antiporter